MTAEINYPTKAPSNSHYLPFSVEKHFLSSVDFVVECVYKSAREIAEKYTDRDFFIRNIASEIVKTSFTSSNFEQMPNAYRSRAQEKLEQFIDEYKSGLKETILSRQLYKEIKNVFYNWSSSCYLMIKEMHQLSQFSLDKIDFITAGKTDEKFDRQLICHDFAFYLLNQEQAIPHIFNPLEKKWPAHFIIDPFTFLSEWGYQLTTSPDAGDLVIYCTTYNGFLEVRHSAIWVKDGVAVSKFGHAEIYEHPIEMVPISYGHFTCFFHKQFQSDLLLKYTIQLDAAIKDAPKFSHEVCFSPLSLQGCKMEMFAILREIPHTKRTFRRGMYNWDYHQKLRNVVLTAIYDFKVNEACQDKKQLLQELQKLILEKAEKVKPSQIYGVATSYVDR